MLDHEKFEITHSEEYKSYLWALCRLSSVYVSEIRRKFASKAYEQYQNETVRKLVLAYGEEARKLDENRIREFEWAANYPDHEYSLEDSCLNKAGSYADAIKFFFEI